MRMKIPPMIYRQRGAIAILFGLTIFVLFGFMALVVDLGRTYVVRTELQNAADAAALAGAKDLNQKLSGITKAIDTVKKIGLQNNTKFTFNGSGGITITDSMISVGSCPDDGTCTMLVANTVTDANATGKTFLKVKIPSGDLATFFAGVANATSGSGVSKTSTYGSAVAGRFIVDVTPIGICAIDLIKGGTISHGAAGLELTEYGFRRGVSYNVFNLAPLGGSSDPYLLNPVDVPPSACSGSGPSADSATATAPFLCNGSSAVIAGTPTATSPTYVYGNPGLTAMPSQLALNTRFGGPLPSQCTTALSDINIRDYPCTANASCPKNAVPGISDPLAYPNTWMDPTNTTTPNDRQTMNLGGITSKEDYGVLWSYSRAAKALGSSPDAIADPNSFFTPSQWSDLYPASPTLTADPTYPGGLAGTSGAPYSAGGVYDQPKLGGVKNGRVLHLAIVDCAKVISAGACHNKIPVVGIGRFFMQVPASLTGGPGNRRLDVEFAGLIEPIPTAEIKLYRNQDL